MTQFIVISVLLALMFLCAIAHNLKSIAETLRKAQTTQEET